MRKYFSLRCIAVFLSVGVLAAPALSQMGGQDKSQRPSPPAKAQCKLAGGKTITVDYSSPRMKGRKIYGGLVPFGEVWRAGANEATTFVTTTDLTLAKALLAFAPTRPTTLVNVAMSAPGRYARQSAANSFGVTMPKS